LSARRASLRLGRRALTCALRGDASAAATTRDSSPEGFVAGPDPFVLYEPKPGSYTGKVSKGVLVVGAMAIFALGCTRETQAPAAPDDPPQIVPWSSLGSVQLGSTVERVRSIYGKPLRRLTLYLPVGTRYASRVGTVESYRVHGGRLVVSYVDGVVKAIETDSRRYRTQDGIGVGASISRGPCRENEYDSCEYTWRSFWFDECGDAWVRTSKPLEIEIGMDRNLRDDRQGQIAWIRFGDPDVVLHCF
jgi:hypothetical protein